MRRGDRARRRATGLESLTMRKLADELGAGAMSLYHYVPNKEVLLDGMIDVVFGEIELPSTDVDWRTAMRRRAISTREVLNRHRWAVGLMESRTQPGARQPPAARRRPRLPPRRPASRSRRRSRPTPSRTPTSTASPSRRRASRSRPRRRARRSRRRRSRSSPSSRRSGSSPSSRRVPVPRRGRRRARRQGRLRLRRPRSSTASTSSSTRSSSGARRLEPGI